MLSFPRTTVLLPIPTALSPIITWLKGLTPRGLISVPIKMDPVAPETELPTIGSLAA